MSHPFLKYIHNNQIISALVFVLIGWFLIQIQKILIALFIAYIIVAALIPFVKMLRSYKVPNAIAASVSFFVVLMLLITLIFPLIPFFVAQIQSLIKVFPAYLNHATKFIGIDVPSFQLSSVVSSELGSIGRNALDITSQIFGGVYFLLTILVLSFYLLIDYDRVKKGVVSLFPARDESKALKTIHQMEEKLGAWIRGQIVLSFAIGSVTWIGLTLLGLDFALPLALIAGILEVIPTIGPIISAVPAVIVALNISPTVSLLVVAMYIVIQALENNFLVPMIMEKAVGLNPILIIIAVMIGGNLMGFMGALLSIPFISMIIILYHSLKEE